MIAKKEMILIVLACMYNMWLQVAEQRGIKYIVIMRQWWRCGKGTTKGLNT